MLHHVSLEVPPEEADRSIEFWGLLGFEEVPAADVLGDSVRWLERDATQIHLILTEGHTAPALGHAAVVAPDHAEAKRRLRDAGRTTEIVPIRTSGDKRPDASLASIGGKGVFIKELEEALVRREIENGPVAQTTAAH